MAAPALRALGAVSSATTTTPSFAAPAGAVASDVIAIGAFVNDGRSTVTGVPAGFLAAPSAPQANGAGAPGHVLIVYYGRFSDVGAGPWSFTVSAPATPFIEGRSAAISGCILAGSPFDATAGATSSGTSVTTAPAISATSTGSDRYALYMATNWASGAWTPPTNFTAEWNTNTKVCFFADETLPTAQTITPQAVCASSSLMNAWVGILLPIPSAPAVPVAGGLFYGTKGNPQAGDVVVNAGPLLAGRYRISGIVKATGTVASADSNNIQLLNSGGTIGGLILPSVADVAVPIPETWMNVASGGTISVAAVANGSGASATYAVELAVRPDALF